MSRPQDPRPARGPQGCNPGVSRTRPTRLGGAGPVARRCHTGATAAAAAARAARARRTTRSPRPRM